MTRSGGQSEARPKCLSPLPSLVLILSSHCRRDERMSRPYPALRLNLESEVQVCSQMHIYPNNVTWKHELYFLMLYRNVLIPQYIEQAKFVMALFSELRQFKVIGTNIRCLAFLAPRKFQNIASEVDDTSSIV
ncbi:hypothetical protein TNCV_2526481 [Trichonephila clavipes]|nr:hypothetical protein TNCV_2526481 [Trichonephila clavipes]